MTNMTRRTRNLLVAFGMLAALALPMAAAAQGMPPPPVTVATVTQTRLAPTISVPGTVISREDSRLAAEVEGRLTWVAEVGTTVAAGDSVARIDDKQLKLQQAENRGLVAREQARLTFLVPEVERLRSLAAQDNLAKSQLEQTISDLGVARSDVIVAQARLEQTEDLLARASIEAPFDGTVTERLQNIGERVNTGQQIVRLVSAGELEIVARAPLQAVHFLDVGGDVAMHNDYRAATGKVRTIVPFGNPESHMFEVRIDVDPQKWIVGESVRVSVPTAEPQEVTAVPRDALVLRREGTSVYRINDDVCGDDETPCQTAEQISVVTGLGDGTMIQISGDVHPGDSVVVRGAERLRPGQPVTVTGSSENLTAGGQVAEPAT